MEQFKIKAPMADAQNHVLAEFEANPRGKRLMPTVSVILGIILLISTFSFARYGFPLLSFVIGLISLVYGVWEFSRCFNRLEIKEDEIVLHQFFGKWIKRIPAEKVDYIKTKAFGIRQKGQYYSFEMYYLKDEKNKTLATINEADYLDCGETMNELVESVNQDSTFLKRQSQKQ